MRRDQCSFTSTQHVLFCGGSVCELVSRSDSMITTCSDSFCYHHSLHSHSDVWKHSYTNSMFLIFCCIHIHHSHLHYTQVESQFKYCLRLLCDHKKGLVIKKSQVITKMVTNCRKMHITGHWPPCDNFGHKLLHWKSCNHNDRSKVSSHYFGRMEVTGGFFDPKWSQAIVWPLVGFR